MLDRPNRPALPQKVLTVSCHPDSQFKQPAACNLRRSVLRLIADEAAHGAAARQPAVNSAHLQAQSRVIAHGFRKAANCGVPTGRHFPAATARTWAWAKLAAPLCSSTADRPQAQALREPAPHTVSRPLSKIWVAPSKSLIASCSSCPLWCSISAVRVVGLAWFSPTGNRPSLWLRVSVRTNWSAPSHAGYWRWPAFFPYNVNSCPGDASC